MIALGLVIVLISCGFLQERIKVNVNFVLERSESIPDFYNLPAEERIALLSPIKSSSNFDYYYSHESLDFVYHCTHTQLTLLKWIITVTSILLFTVLDLGIFWWFGVERHLYKYYFLLSGFLLSLGGSIYVIGILTKQLPILYPISRGILGILQSPVLSLILVPVFKRLPSTQET